MKMYRHVPRAPYIRAGIAVDQRPATGVNRARPLAYDIAFHLPVSLCYLIDGCFTYLRYQQTCYGHTSDKVTRKPTSSDISALFISKYRVKTHKDQLYFGNQSVTGT